MQVPESVARVVCSMPRSGGNMVLSALASGGVCAGEYPERLPDGATVALVHLHYVEHLVRTPERAVLLYRRNLLAQAVSWAVAYRTGSWVDGAPTPPVHIDPAEVVALAGELRAARADWLDWLAVHQVPTLAVAYEDLVAEPQRLRRVVAWCGGNPTNVRTTTRRQSTWVNDVWIGGALADLDAIAAAVPDGIGGRLARAKYARGYVDQTGRRVDRHD